MIVGGEVVELAGGEKVVVKEGRRKVRMRDAGGDGHERMKWRLEMFEADREVSSARFCHYCGGEASPRSMTSSFLSDYRFETLIFTEN